MLVARHQADDVVADLRVKSDEHEAGIRGARSAFESPTPEKTTRNNVGAASSAIPTVMPPALRPSIAMVSALP